LDTLEFGGQFRARGETRNPGANFATAGGADSLFFRTRAFIKAEPAKGLKAKVLIQDSRTSGTEASVAANTANVDLHNGYLDVEGVYDLPLDIRAGRWSLKYGGQRLLSPLDWHNVGRAWDGARLRTKGSWGSADLFGVILNESGRTAATDDILWGLYTAPRPLDGWDTDFYLLARSSGSAATGDLSRQTLGVRVNRPKGFLTGGIEAAYQWGHQSDRMVRAWAMVAEGAINPDVRYSPKFAAEYAYASGDKNPTDGFDQSFDPIFPFGHFYHGFADLAVWKNIHAFKTSVSGKPCKGVWGELALHHFRLAQGSDAWYNAGAAQIARDTTATTGRNVGTELDLHFKTKVRGALKLWFGYSRFIRGTFAKRNLAGGSKDMDWAFLQAVLNF